MWSEEELRDIPEPEPEPAPEPARTGGRFRASSLRAEITGRNLERARHHAHELTRGQSVVYAPGAATGGTHGNFADAAYRRILAHPAWARRLRKAHTGKRQARPTGPDELTRPWHELDTATSSDALLMNIFCYPRVLARPRLLSLLGIAPGTEPVFGYPARIPMLGRGKDRTEIDLRLGHLLIEAKLTESSFGTAPPRLLERYAAFAEVFDPELLRRTPAGDLQHYQLLRGVLAAAAPLPVVALADRASLDDADAAYFCVLLDARRTDLAEAWYSTIRAVRSFQLQSRLRLLTWQDLMPALPRTLCDFLSEKYGL